MKAVTSTQNFEHASRASATTKTRRESCKGCHFHAEFRGRSTTHWEPCKRRHFRAEFLGRSMRRRHSESAPTRTIPARLVRKLQHVHGATARALRQIPPVQGVGLAGGEMPG